MSELTIHYHAAVMTTTKSTSDKFSLPENGLKVSELTRAIVSRYPGVDRVLTTSRWIVDGESIDPLSSFILEGGEDVHVIPRLTGG